MPENTIIYPISVPLDQWPTYPALEMKQATSGNIIHLTATSHGQPVTFPEGTTGEFRAHKKADGTNIDRTEGVSVSGNLTVIEVTSNTLAVPGDIVCDVIFANNGETLGVANFEIKSLPGAIPQKDIKSQDDWQALAEAASAAEAAATQAESSASRAETAADEAESYTSHPNTILENGNWGIWNGTEYVDSGKSAKGQDGRVYEVHAGTGVNVDNSDPANPVISATGAGGDMTKAVYDPAGYNRQLAAETYPDLSTTDKTVPGAINELKSGKMDSLSYSENETWTGKYWTDGRKIYTKLVTGTVPSTGTTISIPHGVSGIGSFRVYDWVKMDNYQCPLFNFALPANNFNWLGFDETNLIFLRGGDGVWAGSPIVAAILYTKASDEPISI